MPHGEEGEDGGDEDEHLADTPDGQTQPVFAVDEEAHREHLHGGFPFADFGNGNHAAMADAAHPFTQRRYPDFATDDDERAQHQPDFRVLLDKDDKHGGDHQFVCHRVKKGAKGAFFFEVARQPAVEEVAGVNPKREPLLPAFRVEVVGDDEEGD